MVGNHADQVISHGEYLQMFVSRQANNSEVANQPSVSCAHSDRKGNAEMINAPGLICQFVYSGHLQHESEHVVNCPICPAYLFDAAKQGTISCGFEMGLERVKIGCAQIRISCEQESAVDTKIVTTNRGRQAAFRRYRLKIQTPRTFPTPEMKFTYAYLSHVAKHQE